MAHAKLGTSTHRLEKRICETLWPEFQHGHDVDIIGNGVANAGVRQREPAERTVNREGTAANISYGRDGNGSLTSSTSTGLLSQPAENWTFTSKLS